MLEELEYTIDEGENTPFNITVYALSTCGFCKRGLAFLRDNKIKFRYIFVDMIGQDLRLRTKKELSDKYNERIGFPFVVLNDGETILVGFKEEKWKETFKV
ncbi:MAG TPA: glutaredoxin family protein [Candidatus Glassbacteria bacterium]|nr:glutaredoxin family protein [Candidatus Glassbacteria bacterium]